MASTKIEWADAVWNPITGCTPISEACDHCYAKRMATRLAGRYGYSADDPFQVTEHWDRLAEPLRWRTSRRVFVVSMGDLFHGGVSEDFLLRVLFFVYAAAARDHTFMFLTKRPERMLVSMMNWMKCSALERLPRNWWIGVTAENQARASERIPILLKIPAAVRFVSIEPMLGHVDLEKAQCTCPWPEDATKTRHLLTCPADQRPRKRWGLDWVICGGETGPGARPMHPDWVRGLRDQCVSAGVPFFFKGWGEYAGLYSFPIGSGVLKSNGGFLDYDKSERPFGDGRTLVWKVGKKKSGRLLDGREWNEFPNSTR